MHGVLAIPQRRVEANGISLNVAILGEGPPVLLVHGWPHTWMVWRDVMPILAAAGRRVIAPDLRGLGGSQRAADGYDLHTGADDLRGLLAALGEDRPALVAALDLGALPAFMLAMRHPDHVRGLCLSETLLGDLPGAEAFLANGPPWWFGFHAVPDLAETVLDGREPDYIDWFLTSGTKDGRGVPAEVRDAFVAAYTGRESLRCGFQYYRAFEGNTQQIRYAVAQGRLTMPTLAAIGGLAGDVVHRQLQPIADELGRVDIGACSHLVPLEQPRAFADAILAFDNLAS